MIGIFGGTFDPVHFGHLRVALDVCEQLALTRLHLIPLYQAVHRAQPGASAELRLAMLRAALAGQHRLVADQHEIERGGPSFTVDTLDELRQEYGVQPLCLLIGADAFNGFPGWHRPDRVLELVHLVVMQRPGHRTTANAALTALIARHACTDPATLRARPAGSILTLDVTQLEISSSDIRMRLASGRSARYLCPDTVLELIEQHGLYRP